MVARTRDLQSESMVKHGKMEAAMAFWSSLVGGKMSRIDSGKEDQILTDGSQDLDLIIRFEYILE